MNINLHIERLMLDGLDLAPEQRLLLQAVVENELSRLLTEGGFSPNLAKGIAVPRLSARDIRVTSANNSTQLGQQIAQSVYGSIGHE